MRWRRLTATVLCLLLAAPTVAGAQNAPPPPPGAVAPVDPAVTPARLSLVHDAVSFWRPGADQWAPAALNTPLAPGDELYTGPAGNVEIQVGPQTFIRGAQETQLGIDNQDVDFVQVHVTLGHVAVDAAQLPQGSAIEVDTPNGAFTIAQRGYYRIDVTGEWTALAVHRGGHATVTTAAGADTPISAGQQVVVSGTDAPRIYLRTAQAFDAWDQWNHARAAELQQGESARYVAGSVYGTDALDRYGTWQVDAAYGRVWLPAAVPAGWVPYSTGRWIWDVRFGWTWLDDAPWGWAPYHYGRWVFVRGRWAWAPGPIVVRSIYAPALVVFLGARTVGRPLCWAPLGWGEPVIPWWGRPGFVGVVTWAGWGGPRVVNNVVVSHTTVNVTNITVYRHVQVTQAVVGVPADRFGRGNDRPARIAAVEVRRLHPVHGAPRVQPVAASVVPRHERGIAPPEASHRREVVGTRRPYEVGPESRPARHSAVPVEGPRRVRVVEPPVRREGPQRPGTPAIRERERDERRGGGDREPRGRQADINRQRPQRPPDVGREPPGRQGDANRPAAPGPLRPGASGERPGRRPDMGPGQPQGHPGARPEPQPRQPGVVTGGQAPARQPQGVPEHPPGRRSDPGGARSATPPPLPGRGQQLDPRGPTQGGRTPQLGPGSPPPQGGRAQQPGGSPQEPSHGRAQQPPRGGRVQQPQVAPQPHGGRAQQPAPRLRQQPEGTPQQPGGAARPAPPQHPSGRPAQPEGAGPQQPGGGGREQHQPGDRERQRSGPSSQAPAPPRRASQPSAAPTSPQIAPPAGAPRSADRAPRQQRGRGRAHQDAGTPATDRDSQRQPR